MPNLDEISERLFIRSQEAVLQLELWIRRQQRLSEIEHEYSADKLADQYNLYMAQLNSLCVRSEYVRDKLNKGCNHGMSTVNQETYVEDLVYEFQDLTLKLNELAHKQKEHCTPSSKSSNGSEDSFRPRPLKIIERHRADVNATRQSPIKENKKVKNVNFSQHDLEDASCPCRCTSLPGSPVRIVSPAKPLRVAKSYDTGLNPNARAKLKKQRENEMLSFFKENQRLSITFCDGGDDDSDSVSDQNTVISSSPPCESTFKPLRRYNSYDSILSSKGQPIPSTKGPAFLSVLTANRPSMKSDMVSSAPVISRTRSKASSKDLLSLFVSNTQGQEVRGKMSSKFPTNSFWSIFKISSQKPKEINTPLDSKRKLTPHANEVRTYPRGVYSSCSRLVVGSQQSRILPAMSQPINSGSLMYDELQEALNTELIL